MFQYTQGHFKIPIISTYSKFLLLLIICRPVVSGLKHVNWYFVTWVHSPQLSQPLPCYWHYVHLCKGRQIGAGWKLAVLPKLRIFLGLLLLGSGRWGYAWYYWRPGLGHSWCQTWESLTNEEMRIEGKSGSDARSIPNVRLCMGGPLLPAPFKILCSAPRSPSFLYHCSPN